MAEIVLGVGTSHSPLLTLPSTDWVHRAKADEVNQRLNLSDGRFVTYEQLLGERGAVYAKDATGANLERQATICEDALDRIADEIQQARLDAVIIVGDDQEELFGPVNQPAISVYYGNEVVMSDKYGNPANPEWVQRMARGYLMDNTHRHPGCPMLAADVISGLLERDVDVSTASEVEDPKVRGFGHAFGFVIDRLFRGKKYPVLPVLLNTYFPPNVIKSSRAYDVGQMLNQVVKNSSLDMRVGVIASGGLSHFVTDADLDLGVINAMVSKDRNKLRSIPRAALNSGSSEILNWVLTAGAIEHLNSSWTVYEPIYRTPAGSGIGMGFGVWK